MVLINYYDFLSQKQNDPTLIQDITSSSRPKAQGNLRMKVEYVNTCDTWLANVLDVGAGCRL